MPFFDVIPPEQDKSTAFTRPIPTFIFVLTLDAFLGFGLYNLLGFCSVHAGHGAGVFESIIGPLFGVIIGFYFPLLQFAVSCIFLLTSFFNPNKKSKAFAHGYLSASLLFALCYYYIIVKHG